MTSKTALDQRNHQRVEKKIVLKVEAGDFSDGVNRWTLVTTQNFSAGGVLFTYDRALPVGTRLRLVIHFPEKAIRCLGFVRRSASSAIEPLFQVAASFDAMNHEDRRFIAQYTF